MGIDCTACDAPCCSVGWLYLLPMDQAVLRARATELGIPLDIEDHGGVGWLAIAPCPFLDAERHCQVYAQRPLMCRLFPFRLVPLPPETAPPVVLPNGEAVQRAIFFLHDCARHRPAGAPTPDEATDLEYWLQAFHITRAQWVGYLALWALHDGAARAAEESLLPHDQKGIARTRARFNALISKEMITAPEMPAEQVHYLALIGQEMWRTYAARCAARRERPTTRGYVRWGCHTIRPRFRDEQGEIALEF